MPDPPPILKGRELILGICGGIAAYKSAEICSKLVQRGAGVTVAMTKDAEKFITPLTFQALSARPVHTDTFTLLDSSDPQHISLTERADLMLIAPATANMLAKVAHGLCDDLISLMISAAACPVVFCPSMNNRMWENPINQENVQKLQQLGYTFLGPDSGWLACRNVGSGRLADPQNIIDEVTKMLTDSASMPKPISNVPRHT
ncbi:MAG TPA: flavoprotein [Tepidisphaeraceae bacterium]|jgi:phosphopantothenoylcysteine decarboxylase/phosphopantothenate--cysteine ligase|nr:flavoprotein [Tepidisphaeraceae bacterium]